ncbi:MAG: Calx-beta domain-containing protein, partial [Pyrinomonadaceae bacterium]
PQNVQPRSKPGATAAPIQQREVKQKVRKGDDSIKPLGACGAPPDPITVGQTINGTLTTSDCALQDGSYFDEYRFNGTAGQQIAVELNSADFDSFLYLLAPDGSLLEVDDDSGGGTDSRIPSEGGFFSLPSTGAYTIYATSFHAEDTGAYTLTLAAPGSGQCPSTHLASGQIFNGALSSTDCFFNTGARNGSFVDIYTFDGRAGQEAIVEMARTSTTIDPYLILISPDEDLPALEDDDSGGNFDARIPSTGTVFLPFNGVYTIYATSFSANETGSYQVRVTLGAPPVASTVVTNTNDSGAGSLRQALLNANSNVGVDTVSFQIGSGARTINLLTELPEITDPVVIDGATQPGFAGTPLIELDGQFTPRGTAGLKITAGGSRVRGLAINRFGVADCFAPFDADIGVGTPIILSQGGGNIIEGNYLGTNQAGTAVACNSGNGVYVFNSSNNVIGGTTAAARNVISGNRFPGIRLGGVFTNGNHIQGNFFGTDATGNADLGNQSNGVAVIDGTNNVVGGTTAGAGNLISGNDSPGVALGFSDPSGILVQANFIGTNAAGNSALPNDGGGIIVGGFFQIDGSPITATDNTIGGTVPGAGNLISGNNGNGIEVINEGSQDNKVQGNFIGTNLAGTAAVANTGSGVFITDAPNNVIGIDDEFDELLFDGTNLISGNVQYGVGVGILRRNDANPSQFITGGDRMLVVLNVIGTDINLNPLGNGLDGVFVDADSVNNRIRFNIIAFNGGSGVRIPDNGNRSGFQINLETNYIYSNNGIGIDLGPAGVTPNDPGDTDGGANLQQNFPDLTAPTLAPITLKGEGTNAPAGTINVSGALSTTAQAGRTYTVHWYFSAGGQCSSNEAASRPRAFGIVPNVTTDAQGRAPFSFPLDFPTDVTSGIVNCTATDAQGNTSEFSACIPVTDAPSTSCATIFPTVQAFNASAGTGRLTVSAPPGCAWTATSNAPWLSVTAGVSGSGTGRVRYSVTANTTSATRIGTLTVAGLTYTVTQTANATTPTIQFSSATYPANEGDPARAVAVTLTRTGDTAGAASVEYATLDDPAPVPCNPLSQPDPGQPPFPRGTAYARCDYVTTIDRLTFAPGEMTKSFLVPLINDVHQDGTETFQLGLRNPEGATLGSRSTAAVTLADDDAAAPTTNPINTTPFFVRMQYLDFLSREPEAGEPWTGVLNGCPNPFNLDAGADSARCDRIIVSQSFFGSPEFQLKGFFVFLYYRATYGLQFLPEYGDITADMRRVTAATDAELVAKRFDFAEDWVQRADFLAQYPANQTNQQYVDRLMDLYNLQQITTEDPANPDGTAQVTLTRAQLVAQLTAGTLSRAQVLRALVQSNEANAREFNNAFVAMQYYGYLRRRPEAEGYAGWLDAIGRRGVSSRVMVDGFMNSAEYRLRFGPNTQ